MIEAPSTDQQVTNLNRWQHAGHVHEFTCPNDQTILTAHNDGWHCFSCPYTQTWAHDAMIEGPPDPPKLSHGK